MLPPSIEQSYMKMENSKPIGYQEINITTEDDIDPEQLKPSPEKPPIYPSAG